MRGNRALRVLVMVMVVSSVVAPATAGQAVAAETPQCTYIDQFIYIYSIGFLNQECSASNLADKLAEFNATDTDEAKTYLHDKGAAVYGGSADMLAVLDNYGKDSQAVAFSKGEAAAVDAIDSGKSLSEAKAAANESVEDYYTTKQLNIIDRYNEIMTDVLLMRNISTEEGLSKEFIDGFTYSGTKTTSGTYLKDRGTNPDNWPTTTITTVNGSAKQVYYPRYEGGNNGNLRFPQDPSGNWSFYDQDADYIGVTSTTELSRTRIIEFDQIARPWERMENASSRTKENLATYVESLYQAHENDNLDLSDYISPGTLAQEYATRYNESGYFAYLVAMSAQAGFAIPDLGRTKFMRIRDTVTGEEYQGLIMSRGSPPNGTWVVGETYNPSNIDGAQFFATTDGNTTELENPFVILSIQGPDGEELDYARVRQIDYTVNSQDGYEDRQENITRVRVNIINREPTAGGGGSGDGGSGGDLLGNFIPDLSSWLGIGATATTVIILVGAVVALGFITRG